MNSIFNQGSTVLARMTDDELVSWLHSEGFAAMPPMVRTEKVYPAASDLELSELGVLRDGEVICKEALNDLSEKELFVIPQRQLDAIRAVLNAAGKSLNERCIGDYFPDIPEI